MPEAVADGRIDAAKIGDPALSTGVDAGKVRILLQKHMKVTFTKAHEYHARTLDPGFVQPLLDAAAQYKIIEPMKAADIIWKG